MTELIEQHSVGPRLSETALRRTIGINYLCCQFGKFSLLPVLVVMLTHGGKGNASAAGFGMFAFLLCVGLSSLPISRWLPRLPYSVTMAAGMVCSAAGFGALAYTTHPVPTLLALCLAGFGNSVHGVLVRVLVAESLAAEPARNIVYAIMQIATNIAAALGPFIAGALYVSGDGRPLLGFVSVAYLAAAATLLLGLPGRLRPPSTIRCTDGARARIRALRHPECVRAITFTVVGAFVYGQFYSAFALFVSLAIDSPVLRAVLLGGPPVAIVLFQSGATALANRGLRAGVAPNTLLALGVIVFGGAIALLGIGLPAVVGATVAMAVFAFAEMLYTPMVSIAFNRLTNVSPLTSSNLQGVSLTTGEALGSLFGGAVFLACYHHGGGDWYWLALGTATVAGVCLRLAKAHTTITVRPDEGH
ncbi:MFS transporter [Streptomyces inhibens]|uniref:MFS transporter n=1 Tax=Streptomyces inhibens TaxID=2293571 RepID=A0A371PPN3_STRIH|nr:MFS transporter [Streptomyces inhibens]REK84500.1 MFS transporter [Streptomyces inhibens]